MGDSVHIPGSNRRGEVSSKKLTRSLLATPSLKISAQLKCRLGGKSEHYAQIVPFLLKVAALEIVRRLSRRKCPLVWQVVQTFQLIAYPPFRWIERWKPFRTLIKGVQNVSRPLLFLSVATTISDLSGSFKEINGNVDDCQRSMDTQVTSETRLPNEASESEDWLFQLHKELDIQRMTIPERIDDNELRRFHSAVNGDFPCLVRSVKRTIRWRETYGIMNLEELESWSHLVFWHGRDLELEPCLVLRLGLACSTLVPQDRPRFIQAIVSQVEHGVLHVLTSDGSRITVLVDCAGLSSTNISLQMIKACSMILQDHFPNRLATLHVLQLCHGLRAMAQTLIHELNPRTQQKIQIEGDANSNALIEILKSAPSFLGGSCTCFICQRPPVVDKSSEDVCVNVPSEGLIMATSRETAGLPYVSSWDNVLRTALVGLLVFWVLVAFLTGMNDTGSFSSN